MKLFILSAALFACAPLCAQDGEAPEGLDELGMIPVVCEDYGGSRKYIRLDPSNMPDSRLNTAEGTFLAMARGGAEKPVANWRSQFHLYAVVHEDGKVRSYIDGKPARTKTPLEVWKEPGVEMAEFRVYDTALSEQQIVQIANGNPPWPKVKGGKKAKRTGIVDKDRVLRLGYELPDEVTVGGDADAKLYAKGILAQCGIGEAKRFELKDGGALAIGSGGLVFDSNYAHNRTCEIVFSGGAIANFESSFMKSAAPVKLDGSVKLVVRGTFVIRAGFEGEGDLVKRGEGIAGVQYPCPDATGVFTVEKGTLVFGPAASWGGTVRVMAGATLKCPSESVIGKLVKEKGAKVVETGTQRRGDLSTDAFPQPATAYDMKKMHRERMGRGVYAFRKSENEVWIGWRYKSSDPDDIAFNVYCGKEKLNAKPISGVTWFVDRRPWNGRARKYSVRGVVKGKEVAYRTSGSWTLPAGARIGYNDIELSPPKPGRTPDGQEYSYFPCDTSIGDLDGDGEYELVVIWWPTVSKDNSQGGQTGETWLEGVKLDGSSRSLWKICLGPNIRSGAHYNPVMVADFDGDGSAEVMCRTANGTRDGRGRILSGGEFRIGARFEDGRAKDFNLVFEPNWVTVFSGETGEALDSIPYRPKVLEDDGAIARRDYQAVKRLWGARNPGNQAFRFLAAVAYLDGVKPSAVFCRGYYSRTCLFALDWNGKKLKEKWFFTTDEERNWGYNGQGFHNLRVGDVDFDGKDEIVYGHMCVDHDGEGLWTTGYGHGDAMHILQADPSTRGLQVWTCHENAPYGVSLIDAQSGKTLLRANGPIDTGSCNAMDIDPDSPGVELFSGAHCGIYSASTLQQLPKPKPKPTIHYYSTLRFGIWWKGDMTRSAYSGGDVIRDYSVKDRVSRDIWSGGGDCDSNHGSKGCPCLIADLFGDWREELLLRRKDNRAIRIYMSAEPTPYRFHTFLEDPVYRESVLTQNAGYNMPTDPGFYFGPELKGHRAVFRGTYLE
ncbi:MAG: hypothetical protein K6F50_03105 [Kiritimatiellae bacterium]|nr:hypothetical protein [Kiritimatiellia bacterium]